ncbi:hypothetical protein FJTKL_00959 [Diaporthe vaccinii]|uniref:Uncharacterized protein n=1 Tax=Diaporthe vaccinii TaxID=105482 RepID=A0ABR4E1R9_9PEZI
MTTHCGPQRQIRDHSAPGDQQLPCFRSPNGCPLNAVDPALSRAEEEVTSLLTHLWIITLSRFTGVILLHHPPKPRHHYYLIIPCYCFPVLSLLA